MQTGGIPFRRCYFSPYGIN